MESKKYYFLDIIKFILSLFIVLLHSNNICNSTFSINTFPYYLFSGIISRIATPLFFTISGFLFFEKLKNIQNDLHSKYLLKYSLRNLKRWFIWSILYIPFLLIIKPDFQFSLRNIIIEFFNFGVCFHLWYLFGVVIAVNLVYFLYKLKLNKIAIALICISLYLIGCLSELNIDILKDFNYFVLNIFKTCRNGLFAGSIFVFIGFDISDNKNKKIDNKKIILLIISLLLFIFSSLLDVSFNLENLTFNLLRNSDFNLFLIPLSYLLMLLFLNVDIKENKIKSYFYRDISLYIYLIHCYVMMFLFLIFEKNIPGNVFYIYLGILNIIFSFSISVIFYFYLKLFKKEKKL